MIIDPISPYSPLTFVIAGCILASTLASGAMAVTLLLVA